MFKASKIALMPELVVHNETARLTRKPTPSVVPPFEASRVMSSRSKSMAPPGATLAERIEMTGYVSRDRRRAHISKTKPLCPGKWTAGDKRSPRRRPTGCGLPKYRDRPAEEYPSTPGPEFPRVCRRIGHGRLPALRDPRSGPSPRRPGAGRNSRRAAARQTRRPTRGRAPPGSIGTSVRKSVVLMRLVHARGGSSLIGLSLEQFASEFVAGAGHPPDCK